MTEAERLARKVCEELGYTPDGRMMTSLRGVILSYGRLVQEAAAKIADKSADGELDDYAAGGAYSAAEAIRAMDLP